MTLVSAVSWSPGDCSGYSWCGAADVLQPPVGKVHSQNLSRGQPPGSGSHAVSSLWLNHLGLAHLPWVVGRCVVCLILYRQALVGLWCAFSVWGSGVHCLQVGVCQQSCNTGRQQGKGVHARRLGTRHVCSHTLCSSSARLQLLQRGLTWAAGWCICAYSSCVLRTRVLFAVGSIPISADSVCCHQLLDQRPAPVCRLAVQHSSELGAAGTLCCWLPYPVLYPSAVRGVV